MRNEQSTATWYRISVFGWSHWFFRLLGVRYWSREDPYLFVVITLPPGTHVVYGLYISTLENEVQNWL